MLTLLVVLSACGSCGPDDSTRTGSSTLSAKQAEAQTCEEVRAGIDEFNVGDYAGTVHHFEMARATAKIYATVSDRPEADALLDAVEYYADLDPADYPEAARSSEHFARNKAITLGQCATDAPGEEPGTEV